MFFPYRDDNPTERFPIITVSLISINVLLFLIFALQPDYELVVKLYGFTPAEFKPLTFLTSIFLHADFFHLIFNMWFLWLFGDNLEDKFGKGLFLVFYLVAGVWATSIHALASSETARGIPCIGASGAISAVMGGYVVLFPGAKIRCLVSYFFHLTRVSVSTILFLGIWFLGQLLYSSLSGNNLEGITNVAYGAHIGGFLFGLAFTFFIKGFVFRFR